MFFYGSAYEVSRVLTCQHMSSVIRREGFECTVNGFVLANACLFERLAVNRVFFTPFVDFFFSFYFRGRILC